jgi:general secretion pathway protein A
MDAAARSHESMGYVDFWELREKPFEEVSDTRFFYESEGHREALDRMLYVVNDRNMNIGLFTGEIGSGKTLTRNVLIATLPRNLFEIIEFENSNYAFEDLLFDIVRRIAAEHPHAPPAGESHFPARSDKFALMRLFRSQLEYLCYEEKRHLVLIFDEAQQMEDGALDEIKNFTNFSAQAENFLTVFFVGQPELREKIRRLRQLDQRIFLRFHLNNLDFRSTVGYIDHRLHIAGRAKNGVFGDAAHELIFRETGGVPREINRLCKLALHYGFAHDLPAISTDDIQAVLDDMKAQGG